MPCLIFQTPASLKPQLLQALLITLSLTTPLESRGIKNIIQGFVANERVYVANQKTRGWLTKEEDFLVLTPQAKQRLQFGSIKLTHNKSRGDTKFRHEFLLARCLFLCLMHLPFPSIEHIQKQKSSNYKAFIPDLTIVTNSQILYIEVDTGSEPIHTLQSKINYFQAQNFAANLIYFTNSISAYNHFREQNSTPFIYLQSQTLSQDMQRLFSSGSVFNNQKSVQHWWHNPVLKQASNISFQTTTYLDPQASTVQDFWQEQSSVTALADNNPLSYQNKQENYQERRDQIIRLLFEQDYNDEVDSSDAE